MKLHLTQAEGNNLITGFDTGKVSVNAQDYNASLIVQAKHLQTDWPISHFDQLTENAFEQLAESKPEVVILGTGSKHRFAHPKLSKILSEQNIPVECMTTDAACRTYNILMSEGRDVLAALIIETD